MRLERLNQPRELQTYPNPAKPGHGWSKAIKGKGLDSLGSPCPNRAFSEGCADSQAFFDFARGGAGRRRGGPGALHWNRDHGKNIPYVSISRNNFLFTPARRLHERRSRRSRTRKPADIELAIAARVGIGGILPPLPPPGSAAYVGPPPCGLPRPSPGRDCAARFSAVIDRKPPIHEPSAANTT